MKWSCLCFLLFFMPSLYGQKNKADSLLQAIGEAQSKQEKFQANLAAARWFDVNDLRHSQPFLDETMRIAGELNDAKSTALAWMERGYHYHRRGMSDSSVLAYLRALEYSRAAGVVSDESSILGNISSGYLNLGKIAAAQRFATSQLEFAQKHHMLRDEGSAHALFARIYDFNGNVPEAIAELQKAVAHFEKFGFQENLPAIFSEIGAEYEILGQYETALHWFQKALILFEKRNEEFAVSEMLGNIGNMYDMLGKADSAIYYSKKSIYLAQKSGNRRQEAYALNNLGIVFDIQGDKKAALDCYIKSLKIKEVLADSASFASNYINIGALQMGLSQLSAAKVSLEKGLFFSEQFQQLDFQQEALQNLSDLHEKRGDYKNSLLFLRRYYIIRDSLASPADRDSVMALQARFNDEKEGRLRAENETSKLLAEEKSRRAFFFGLLSVATIGLAGLSLWFLIFARRKNRQLELLLQEVQHRAKNNLQNVGALLTLFSRDMRDPQARDALEEGRRRVDAMKILEQQLLHRPFKPSQINASDYLGELIDTLAASLPTKSAINIRREIQPIEMDVEKAMSIGLIINELVINAVKHAQTAPAIFISLQKEGKFRLIVEDNGTGLPEALNAERSNSFGLKIVRLFADKLKASLMQSNTPGARFEFVFE